MNKLILLFCLIFLMGCIRKNDIKVSQPIVVADGLAGGSYFTRDHLGNTVVCWTAGEKGNAQLYYALYNEHTASLDEAVVVAPSKGTGLHEESMNKVAFKNDGTIIAVYEKRHPTEKNKYAGSILYTQSFDGGRSWSKEKFIHTDSTPGNSRSFFDIATLPDGEVGAVWLDSRLKNGGAGTSLFFSKTKGKNGFLSDWLIGESVCQCCRTDLYTDPNGNVHAVYRDVESSIKGQVRDFAHVVSFDNGSTFSPPQIISRDNWLIEGCPHTGSSVTGDQNKIEIVWFTAGGTPGLYHTMSTDHGKSFQPRQMISQEARHPQIASFGDQSIIVWDGAKVKNTQSHSDHDHGEHSMPEDKSAVTMLIQSAQNNGNRVFKVVDDNGSEFPVVSMLGSNAALVAYAKNNQVIVRRVNY